jgi:hypothetical protein|tara:strand:+ start:584 stop:754 length:171 start_codon:yes stop_codon:yes gene_type:complete
MALVWILITGFIMFKIFTHPLKALSYLGLMCIALVLGSLFWLTMVGIILHVNGVIQ